MATRFSSGRSSVPRSGLSGGGKSWSRRSFLLAAFPAEGLDGRDRHKKAGHRPASLSGAAIESDDLNIRRLLSLRALGDSEAHLLSLLQRLEPRHVDRREVGEQIL